MAKRKKRSKRLPPLALVDVPKRPTTDESHQVVEVLWKFVSDISKLTTAQKKEMDGWIAAQWGIVVLRTENLEKMLPDIADTLAAYDLLERLSR